MKKSMLKFLFLAPGYLFWGLQVTACALLLIAFARHRVWIAVLGAVYLASLSDDQLATVRANGQWFDEASTDRDHEQ
jgi:hypothetical protein